MLMEGTVSEIEVQVFIEGHGWISFTPDSVEAHSSLFMALKTDFFRAIYGLVDM